MGEVIDYNLSWDEISGPEVGRDFILEMLERVDHETAGRFGPWFSAEATSYDDFELAIRDLSLRIDSVLFSLYYETSYGEYGVTYFYRGRVQYGGAEIVYQDPDPKILGIPEEEI